VRRAIFCVPVLFALVAPAAATAARIYTSDYLEVLLKTNKPQVKKLGAGDVPVTCDEGKTTIDSGAPVRYNLQPPLPLKKRKLHAELDKTQNFAVGSDPVTGDVVVAHLKFHLSLRGKFNKRYTKASGAFRFTGDFLGPKPNPQIEGEKIPYHNCDSGTLAWRAHLFHYRAE
jgi:hypothetical protein